MQVKSNLKILFVSAEVSPFAKTGGLADVAGSLPQTLAANGHDIRVVMPKYKMISEPMNYVTDFPVQVGDKKETCIIRETDTFCIGNCKRVPTYFVDNYNYFDRDNIYCYFDDADRFAFFCESVLEMLPKINFQPDVIHCNDWHTGPICMLLKEKYKKESYYSGISTIFTIHNLEYQGNFSRDVFKLWGLGDELFTPEKAEFYGMFSFMKTGLVYADIINTVSETYAKEIQTPEYGEKLDGLLRSRSNDLFGVVNGVSYEVFNPETDSKIYKNYNSGNFEYKKENKSGLQREMGLPIADSPLIGLVSRLTGQKGLNLIVDSFEQLMNRDLQFVLLGSGDEYYESIFKDFQKRFPQKFSAYIGFNAELAQRIYAGSDIFLMPSRFEPCGLGQIISLRYGTIPVVRSIGGLADTITDFDENKADGNGFSFTEFSSSGMMKAIDRALKAYYEDTSAWLDLVKKALNQDFSWNKPAKKYTDLYYLAMNK